MFGSTIIDVLIGLFLVYIVLSMMASAMNEYVSNLLDKRAKDLEKFVQNLFAEKANTDSQASKDINGSIFVKRPKDLKKFVQNLFAEKTNTDSQALKDFNGSIFINSQIGAKQLPSYIKREDFAQAVFDIAKLTVNASDNLKTLRETVEKLPGGSPIQKVLLNAIDRTDGTRAKMEEYLEKWFDGQMDHLRTQYKKWTNYFLLAFGLIIAIILNVDTIRITDSLLTNPALRDAIVEQAKNVQPTANEDPSLDKLYGKLQGLSLPIGWPDPTAPPSTSSDFNFWLIKKIIGILVTGFAVSQGAPFWFDLLNKITNLRATTRPPDEQAKHDPKPPQSTDAAATAAAAAIGPMVPTGPAGATGAAGANTKDQ